MSRVVAAIAAECGVVRAAVTREIVSAADAVEVQVSTCPVLAVASLRARPLDVALVDRRHAHFLRKCVGRVVEMLTSIC